MLNLLLPIKDGYLFRYIDPLSQVVSQWFSRHGNISKQSNIEVWKYIDMSDFNIDAKKQSLGYCHFDEFGDEFSLMNLIKSETCKPLPNIQK